MQIPIDVSKQDIMYQFCAAFEGGSNYWLRGWAWAGKKEPKDSICIWYADEELYNEDMLIEVEYDDPDSDDGSTKEYKITYKDLVKGLKVMANDHPRHFANMIGDNADAITADVFLQCVLFKDVIYG